MLCLVYIVYEDMYRIFGMTGPLEMLDVQT